MRTIDIVTAHKVEINYPLASVGQRILAFLIDLAIVSVACILISLFFEAILSHTLFPYVQLLVLSPLTIFYTLYSEILLNGQTLGKKAFDIRVVKLNGENLIFSDYLIRWVFRLVDIWLSMGSLAIIFISSNEKSQRIGDVFSNTSVIQMSSLRNYALSDVLNIMSFDNHQVVFSGAKNFTESQMLLLKETLERHKKHNNYAHHLALKTLSLKLSKELGLKKLTMSDEKFLKTVLRDYIFLTR